MADKSNTNDGEIILPGDLFGQGVQFDAVSQHQAAYEERARLIMDEHQALVILEFLVRKKKNEFYHALGFGKTRHAAEADANA